MDQETAGEIERHFDVVAEGLRSDLQAHFGVVAEGLRSDLQARFGVVAEGLRSDLQGVKRHFDVVAEGLRSDVGLVAEGVAGLDEKFTLEFEKVREEIGEVKGLL
ncbi:MAG: hypothetical protein ACREDF_02380, partial [Thermoplasmata archaeon]